MSQQRTFNLIDENWIPVSNGNAIGLKEIFSNQAPDALQGNPIQKIAVFKLLQAIAQAACPLKNEEEWKSLTLDEFRSRCLEYLDHWHDRFDLYGEKPFLQMPAVQKAKILSYGALNPEKAAGNTTVLTQFQVDHPIDDAQRALLIVQLMGFATGGKKTDNSIVLAPGYTGKSKAGKPGTSLGFLGYLHSFAYTSNIAETIWLNLLTEEDVSAMRIYPEGIGQAPWEEMPTSEDCAIAKKLRQTLMGRLIPLCRFCLLAEDGMHYSEGIAHPSHINGVYDPTLTVMRNAKELKPLWVDPKKRPWRSLTAILGFLSGGLSTKDKYDCRQLAVALTRLRETLGDDAFITVWSGGLRVSSNAGEQYVSGGDDFVESTFQLTGSQASENWFLRFADELTRLDEASGRLYGSILNYYKDFKVQGGDRAASAVRNFWNTSEANLQSLINACGTDDDGTSLESVRKIYWAIYKRTYDEACPHETARQVIAWVKNFRSMNKSKVKK